MGKCKGLTQVFSRVTGFFSAVQNWNKGKGINGEYKDRKMLDLKKVKEKK